MSVLNNIMPKQRKYEKVNGGWEHHHNRHLLLLLCGFVKVVPLPAAPTKAPKKKIATSLKSSLYQHAFR
jgi:hypothetical protein